MGEQAAAMGLPGSFEWQGRTWEFVPYDNIAVVRQFEDWLIADARSQLQRELENKTLTASEHQEELRQLRRDINSKMYAWGGSVCAAAIGQTVGLKQMTLLMLKGRKRDVSTETVEALWADEANRQRVLIQMGLLVEIDDPNAKSPADNDLTGPESTPTSSSPNLPIESPRPSGPS